jgi:hypothetical protein
MITKLKFLVGQNSNNTYTYINVDLYNIKLDDNNYLYQIINSRTTPVSGHVDNGSRTKQLFNYLITPNFTFKIIEKENTIDIEMYCKLCKYVRYKDFYPHEIILIHNENDPLVEDKEC